MSQSRAIALLLLPCVLLTTACSSSAFLVKRDPPPASMLQKPEPPQLAPEGATDNEIAEERVRFGEAYRVLEKMFDGLVCYVVECKPAPTPLAK